jgi:hypothetical protein
MAQMIVPDSEATRWRDRFRQDTHPVVGSASFTAALVAVGVVSVFVPAIGVLAIAVVAAILIHAAITAAVKR